eukprot:2576837-Rhodomonas_salina.1
MPGGFLRWHGGSCGKRMRLEATWSGWAAFSCGGVSAWRRMNSCECSAAGYALYILSRVTVIDRSSRSPSRRAAPRRRPRRCAPRR